MLEEFQFRRRYFATRNSIESNELLKELLDDLEKTAIEYVDRVLDLEIYKETNKDNYDKYEIERLDDARKRKHNALVSCAQALARNIKKNMNSLINYPHHDIFHGYNLNDRYSIAKWAFDFVKAFHPRNLKRH